MKPCLVDYKTIIDETQIVKKIKPKIQPKIESNINYIILFLILWDTFYNNRFLYSIFKE